MKNNIQPYRTGTVTVVPDCFAERPDVDQIFRQISPGTLIKSL